MKKGLFITLEGSDGSGKSTQSQKLKDYLSGLKRDVLLTREPGGTKISEDIREILLNARNSGMNAVTESLLYMAARAELVDKIIKPALNEGKIVVCDRFVDSSFAYQGIGRNLGIDYISSLYDLSMGGFLPDITFWIDLSPQDAFKRKGGQDKKDRLEMSGNDFFDKVYEGFRQVADKFPSRIKRIDGRLNADEIFNDIRAHLDVLL